MRRSALRLLLDLALSAIASALIVGAGALALFSASWPKWLSLTVEPVSLLLAPGVVASLLFTRIHDYTEEAILQTDLLFYFLLMFVLLVGSRRRARRHSPRA